MALAEHNGKIYMFGGYRLPDAGQATWIPMDTAWEYDPRADSWRPLPPLAVARGSADAAVVNGRIHVIGGATLPPGVQGTSYHPNRNVSVGAHEVFDLASNTWSRRAELPTPHDV